MKSKCLFIIIIMTFCLPICGRAQKTVENSGFEVPAGYIRHPWHGLRVGYLGDSITDPRNNSNDIKKKYWGFLQDWLGITPYVYGVSGRQWNDVPRQAEELKQEHGDEVDAIMVFIGTNDFNAGVPVGEWFDEQTDTVTAAVHGEKKVYRRKRRSPVMSNKTLKGRINIGISKMKALFPDKQIVLLTPLHRAYAKFSDKNIQPDEGWQNACGEYFDRYVDAVKEAGNVWSVPVIDLNADSGINPMIDGQLPYIHREDTDRLHPSTEGQRRMALTLMYRLMSLPGKF